MTASPLAPIRVLLAEVDRPGRWQAFFEGKASPILRQVPGNTRPASAAEWRTEADARAELPVLLGCAVEVVAIKCFGFRNPDGCRICGDKSCDGRRHERAAEGDEDNRGGGPRP